MSIAEPNCCQVSINTIETMEKRLSEIKDTGSIPNQPITALIGPTGSYIQRHIPYRTTPGTTYGRYAAIRAKPWKNFNSDIAIDAAIGTQNPITSVKNMKYSVFLTESITSGFLKILI
ncbi:hypothetical protein D3C76_1357660 [compost metagenome]